MLKRACLFSLLLYLAIAGTYWYFLRLSIPPLPAVLVSLFLALFASAGLGVIRTSLQINKTTRLFSDAEAGAPLQDGKKMVIAGRINPQGFPGRTPFQEKDCVLYEYEIKYSKQDAEDTACDFVGIKMVPCSIHSSRGNVRLIGFPHLDHIEYESVHEPEAQEIARRFVQSTKFEKGSLLSVGKMISGLLDAWRDDDGVVQKDWRITKDENFKEGSVLKEKYFSPGDSVVAIGVYSAAQNGLIAPKDDSIDIVRGDLRSARETLIEKKKGNITTGIVFFLAAQFFFGALYFISEKREAFQSPQEQSATLHQAASSRDYKLLAKLKRNGVSLDMPDASGKTPLMNTIEPEVAKYLLENGANVNAVDPQTGETAIFNAARNGWEELLRLYIKHGADVQAVSKIPWEHSPIHTAIESGLPQLVSILREHGARDDRVDSINGKALTERAEQFEVIRNYHIAIQEQDLEDLKRLTTPRQSGFFENVDFNVWKYYYPAEMEFVEGFTNDSAAT